MASATSDSEESDVDFDEFGETSSDSEDDDPVDIKEELAEA